MFKYGVAAVLLVVPIYPKFPVFNVPGTYVAVRVEDFLICVLGVYWLIYYLRHNPQEFFRDRFNKAILLFWFIGLLSIVSSVLLTKTTVVHLSLLHWARRVEYLVPFFVAVSAVRYRARPKFFVEVLLIASVVVAIYGLGQIYFGFPVISTQNAEYSKGLALSWIPGARVHSTFAGHYDLAAFYVMVLPIALAYLFALKRWVNRLSTFFVFILPSFWLFLQTESRVSFVSYLVAVVVCFWVIKRKLFIVPVVVLSLLAMIFLSDLGVRYRETLMIYGKGFFSGAKINFVVPSPVYAFTAEELNPVERRPSGIEDRSVAIRLNVEWPRAFRAFLKNPLLGTGYSSITLATDNDYLRMLGEVGVVGALAFFLVLLRLVEGFGRFLRSAVSLDVNTAYVGGFFGAFAGFLVNATFIDVFEASKAAIIFWTLAGVGVGLVKYGMVAERDT